MGQPNEVLAGCLHQLGWSPRQLALQINRLYQRGAVSVSAPYHWRDAGKVPRPPVPSLAARVLSAALGRPVTVEELWGGEAQDSPLVHLASSGLTEEWSPEGTAQLTRDWLHGGLVDRRLFLAVSGTALAQAVWAYLDSDSRRVSPPVLPVSDDGPDTLINQIEKSVPMLQALDDTHGGAAHLGYVGAQVRAVALVLNDGDYSGNAQRRLLVALADLAQLAGWKAFDASQHGLAQRYYFTALRAAHDVGYPTMAAHTLADLAVQAVARHDHADAVSLAEAANRQAESTSPGVRACVQSRLAHAYAANGQIAEFERATADALEAVVRRQPDEEPDWLYYLTPAHIECQAGYSYVIAGRQAMADGETRSSRALLRRGIHLLSQGAHGLPLDDPSQRRALYEGAWLALGYAGAGKLDEACSVTELAIQRLGTVQSPRSVGLLRDLERDLTRRRRSRVVQAVLPDLQSALARQSA